MKTQTMRQGQGDVSVKQTTQEMEYPRVVEFKVCIRPSVDGLYRDGTVHISREMHKQCFITRREMTSRAPKPRRSGLSAT